jgi:hypothetical protein
MAESQTEIVTETGSPIESGIEQTWDHYAYADDGEHAMVVGVERTPERDEGGFESTSGWSVEYAVYVCEMGLVDRLKGPSTRVFDPRPNNLADAAKQILEQLAEEDGRDPIEAAGDYWSDE